MTLEDVSEAINEVTIAIDRVDRLVMAQNQARLDWPPTDTATQTMHEIVDYLVPGVTPGGTWCNQATKIIARDVGAPWKGDALLDNSATEITRNLRNMGPNGAYRVVTSEDEAVALANDGFLVIAAATAWEVENGEVDDPEKATEAWEKKHHGHVVTLRPRLEDDPGTADYSDAGSGVLVNHIGHSVGIRRMSGAFGDIWQLATYHTPSEPYG